MTQDERDQDRSVLAFLKGYSSPAVGEDDHAPAVPERLGNDVDEFLRAMGYNRIERERLRRGQSRPRNEDKYRTATRKRFVHYIAKRLPDRPAEEVAALAEAWVALTKYDLDLAQRWWGGGVDPRTPGQLTNAIAAGFRVEDLGAVVHNRTIAEHLQAGNSLRWCMLALDMSRRGRSA